MIIRAMRLKTLLGNYPVTGALREGRVRSSLVELDIADVKVPHTAFKRVVRDLEFDVAEIAIVTYLMAKSFGKPLRLLPETIAALQRYRWPGNVRELANLLERLSIQAGGQPVGVADLPERYQPADWIPPVEVADAQLTPVQLAINRVHDPLAELKNLADEDLPAAANGSSPAAPGACSALPSSRASSGNQRRR